MQVECEQDSMGRFECYYNNYVKDCETGDLNVWRSGDQMTKYPVKCPQPAGPPGLIRGELEMTGPKDLLREGSARPKPVQRPFSYADDFGARSKQEGWL